MNDNVSHPKNSETISSCVIKRILTKKKVYNRIFILIDYGRLINYLDNSR